MPQSVLNQRSQLGGVTLICHRKTKLPPAASGLFRGYLHFLNNYSRTYGSLGAVIILLLWLYVTAITFLIGGEINPIIEQAAAHGHPEARAAGQKKAA